MNIQDDILVPVREVRKELGTISEMTLWRRVNQPDPADPPFPKLVKIRGRNYVWRSDLDRYKGELRARQGEVAA